MTKNHRRLVSLISVVGLTALLHCVPASAQDTAVTGTVASSTKNTLTINIGSGQYQLYTFTKNPVKPESLAVGTQVQVISSAGTEPDVRVAREVTIVQRGAPAPTAATLDTVPSNVHQLERDIERQLRKFQVAVTAGVALDPELVIIGGNVQIGPVKRSGLYFRPGVELGIGEVTTMIGFNGEMIYRLPITSASDRWSSYLGGGIGVNLIDQSFNGEEDGNRFSFGDFKSDTALNLVAGVRRRNGVFLELRTSIYSEPSPTLRLLVGYTF